MRLMPLVLILSLSLTTMASANEGTPSDAEDLLFLASDRPVLVRLHLKLNGTSHRTAWNRFIQYVFQYLDKDKNGTLSKEEAKGMPNPTNPNWIWTTASVTPDKNKDGKTTLEELKAFYKTYGSRPFRPGTMPSMNPGYYMAWGQRAGTRDATALNNAILKVLDANKDGKLSRTEMKQAEALLLKRDFDDDEMVTAAEIQGRATTGQGLYQSLAIYNGRMATPATYSNLYIHLGAPNAATSAVNRMLQTYTSLKEKAKADHLTQKEIGLPAELFQELDKDNNGKLSKTELARFVSRKPDLELQIAQGKQKKIALVQKNGKPLSKAVSFSSETRALLELGVTELEFTLDPARQGGGAVITRVNRSGGKAQFNAADRDKNGYLDRNEARANAIYFNNFIKMDSDGDGQLFYKEVQAYMKETAELSRRSEESCVSMGITEDGRGIYGMLDLDGDDRLSVREIRKAVEQIKRLDRNGDQAISLNEIPRRYSIYFGKGPAAQNNWSNSVILLSGSGGATSPRKPVRTKGPLWFRKMDRNRDGDVSKREFLGSDAIFQKIDQDKDRLLSVEEAQKADALFRKK